MPEEIPKHTSLHYFAECIVITSETNICLNAVQSLLVWGFFYG